jgi:hypothetical protein
MIKRTNKPLRVLTPGVNVSGVHLIFTKGQGEVKD